MSDSWIDGRLAISIASYSGDRQVIDRLHECVTLRPLCKRISVVDSGPREDCKALEEEIHATFTGVEYIWFEENLGAAGNVVKRITWAQLTEASHLLAVNADGKICTDVTVEMMRLSVATSSSAVYPCYVNERGQVDFSYTDRVPILPRRRYARDVKAQSSMKVRWGSSNGALYHLEAFEGFSFENLASLWHGWEDLAIGLHIDAMSGHQVMSTALHQPTPNDQKVMRVTGLVVSNKTAWTTYYSIRNLLMLSNLYPELRFRLRLRAVREVLMISVRPEKVHRAIFAMKAVWDGVRMNAGMVVKP